MFRVLFPTLLSINANALTIELSDFNDSSIVEFKNLSAASRKSYCEKISCCIFKINSAPNDFPSNPYPFSP